jgi:hypothetical protein
MRSQNRSQNRRFYCRFWTIFTPSAPNGVFILVDTRAQRVESSANATRFDALLLPLTNCQHGAEVTPRRRRSFSIATPGSGVAVLLKRYTAPRLTRIPC